MKTSELIGAELNCWVAQADGETVYHYTDLILGKYYTKDIYTPIPYSPSTNWQQGGPLIEKYKLDVFFTWKASRWDALISDDPSCSYRYRGEGETPLIAVCRCIVASKYGDEVEDN